ncbi:MAG: ribosomal protein S18-alanine N-acetyltransferase [Clostridiaceae bacterium]|nr:ribosomal protein S18-alanine N-acetyltransferase [Clostridiaceae bacterium]
MIDLEKIKICQMTLYDLEELKDVLLSDFDDFWNFQIFKDELVNTNSKYFLLRYDTEIVCLGGIKIILDEANIMNIITKKNKRNNGFAKFLLNSLIDISKEFKCKTITLEVNENNTSAISLYKHFNFEEVGKRKKYYKNGDTAILMTHKIN